MARTTFSPNKPQTEDALHKSAGRFLYSAFVECCWNLVYHLAICGVYEGLREDKQMEEKEEKKTDERGKCFVMMPISDQGDYPEGHFQKVYEQIFQPAIEKAGYQPYRVDENAISDRIIDKIFRAIQECPMALCDLSNRNPNVLYELGLRQAYDKPVVLVQDEKTERIFDVSGISTVQYKSQRLFENVLEARDRIANAIIETKEGRQNSIVKIVQAKTAHIPAGDISKEDKIEIMLSGLINDIKEIKDSNNNEVVLRSGILTNGQIIAGTIDNDKYTINLKHGVTNSRIEREIQRICHIYGVGIEYNRKGDRLILKVSDYPPFMVDDLVDELAKNISE